MQAGIEENQGAPNSRHAEIHSGTHGELSCQSKSPCLSKSVCPGWSAHGHTQTQTDGETARRTDRETDSQTETETDRQRDTDRQTDRQAERQTVKHTETDTDNTQTQAGASTARHPGAIGRPRHGEDTDRQTNRQTDTHTDTHTDTDRHRHTQP